jgi:iron complex transport system substrate-binding protein
MSRRRRRPFILLTSLAAILGIALSSCSSSDHQAADDADSSTTITVTDQRGVEVTIDGPVERIVSAVIPAPTIIAAVDGSWDRIVGINDSLLTANKQGIISTIFPDSVTTDVVADRSFVPDMEKILELDPDVVVQWGDRGADILSPIEEAGIPVIGLEYGTQEDLEDWVSIFGQILQKEDRADQILENMHTEAATLSGTVTELGTTSPRGLQLTYSADQLSVANKTNYAQYVFDLAGVTNVAKDAEVTDGVVSAEQILDWDPEIIFLSAFSTNVPDDLYSDPRFADVSAVANKRVYRTPLGVYRWQVPCAESPLFWNWVAALAHPGSYQVDLPALMKEQISSIYGYELTDEDVKLILRTDINSASASYDAVS